MHILNNADGVGVGLGFVILCYIWWGVVLTLLYNTFEIFNICHFLTFNSTFNNFTAVFLNCYVFKIIELLIKLTVLIKISFKYSFFIKIAKLQLNHFNRLVINMNGKKNWGWGWVLQLLYNIGGVVSRNVILCYIG